jgi:hypothetical protein
MHPFAQSWEWCGPTKSRMGFAPMSAHSYILNNSFFEIQPIGKKHFFTITAQLKA